MWGLGWAGTLLKTAKQGRGLQGMGELMEFEEEGKGNGESFREKSYMWEREPVKLSPLIPDSFLATPERKG